MLINKHQNFDIKISTLFLRQNFNTFLMTVNIFLHFQHFLDIKIWTSIQHQNCLLRKFELVVLLLFHSFSKLVAVVISYLDFLHLQMNSTKNQFPTKIIKTLYLVWFSYMQNQTFAQNRLDMQTWQKWGSLLPKGTYCSYLNKFD